MDLKDRKFFCSELVAKTFKETKLLKSDLPCNKFLPGSFSVENMNFKLQNNSWLGEEEMIIFDEVDI